MQQKNERSKEKAYPVSEDYAKGFFDRKDLYTLNKNRSQLEQ